MDDKIKYELEFPIHASPAMLYTHISTPSGLSEWYADDVNSRGELFTFIWDGSEEQAKLLNKKSNERVKFRWLEDFHWKFRWLPCLLQNVFSIFMALKRVISGCNCSFHYSFFPF